MRTSTFTARVLADLLAGRSTTTAGPGNSAGEVRLETAPRDPMPTTRRRRKVVQSYRSTGTQ